MKWRYTQYLYASLGDLYLADENPEQAIAFADTCLGLAEAKGSRRNIVKARRVRGRAFVVLGRLEEAETELVEAVRLAREVGNPAQLWQTLEGLGRLYRAQRRAERALAAYQEAIGIMERVAAGLSDPALRDTLLASPQLSALREAATRA